MTTDVMEPAPASGATQVLTFSLGDEHFGIRIHHIKEIIGYRRITPVPSMPAWIRGVINLRGVVVPVLDLSLRLDRPARAATSRTCIVVIEIDADSERHDVGVVVDAVSAVIELPAHDIEPAAAIGVSLQSGFVSGMGKIDGRFVILLEPDKVLSHGAPTSSEPRN